MKRMEHVWSFLQDSSSSSIKDDMSAEGCCFIALTTVCPPPQLSLGDFFGPLLSVSKRRKRKVYVPEAYFMSATVSWFVTEV